MVDAKSLPDTDYFLLLDVCIPEEVLKFITGLKIVIFILYYISMSYIPYLETIIEYFTYAHKNDYLEELGYHSASCLVNQLHIILSFLRVLLIFTQVYFFY
jgi:hypothetical protein